MEKGPKIEKDPLDDGPEDDTSMFVQLKACHFVKTSKRVWKLICNEHTITFIGLTELPEDYTVRVSDLDDKSTNVVWKQIREDSNPVKNFVDWAYANSASREVPGEIVGVSVGDKNTSFTLERQPTPSRSLIVSTWGIALRKHAPERSQRNWFVGIISNRAHGVDLRKLNGRSEEVQEGVLEDPKFGMIMNSIIKEVEEKDLTHISVSCTKGRHRSVAVAELLKKLFYPNDILEHLTIS